MKLRFFLFMEIWKDIKGFECIYQVSSLGNIRSFLKIKNNVTYKNAK